MQCPAILLSCPKGAPANTDTNPQQQCEGTKCHSGYQQYKPSMGGYGPKKPHTQMLETHPHNTENYWNENKHYDMSLKQTKQTNLQHQCTNLGQVLQAASMTTLEALNKLNLPTMLCSHYTLWGGCSDPTCSLHHNDTLLTPNHINQIKGFLTDGARKLLPPNPMQT